MNVWLESLVVWLVDFACISTVLLLAALLMRLVIRDAVGRVRLLWGAWLTVIAAGAIAACPLWPRIAVADLLRTKAAPQQTPVVVEHSEVSPAMLTAAQQDMFVVATSSAARYALSGQSLSLPEMAAGLWLSSAVAAMGWLAIGRWRTWRLVRSSLPAPGWACDELRLLAGNRPPALRTSKRLPTAIALGALRPRIVLPYASAVESNAPAVRAALAHEYAHIRHGDLWLLGLERLLVPLLAVHPLFWWLRRLTRLDQEILADAAAAGDRPVEYAEALVAWAKAGPPQCVGLAALAMWEQPSNLTRRVRMLLDSKDRKASHSNHVGGLTAVAMMLVMAAGLSCLSLGPMAAQEPAAAKVVPASDPRPAPTPSDPRSESQQVILLDLELRSLDSASWESTKSTLVDISKRDAGDHSQLMFREVTSEQTKALTEQLDKERGAQIISRPKVMTLAGQEAVVQIGSAAPLESETVIDGKVKRHIRLVQIGQLMRFTPTLMDVDPQQLGLAILVEQTDMKLKDDSPAGEKIQFPMLFSRRYELKAVVELGRTLVILEPKTQGRDGLLVRITPKLVERPLTDHSHLNPVPPMAAGVADKGTVVHAPRGGETAVNDDALANQLRNVRETLQSLAREREQTRAENAALKQQLEQFRLRLSELGDGKEPSAAGVPLGLPTNPVLPPADPQPKAAAKSLVSFSIKYHKAETLGKMLWELCQASKVDANIQADPRTNTLIVDADEQGQAIITSLLRQLDTNTPTWAPPGESRAGIDAPTNHPSAERAQAEVKLLELDLKAAEIDLQAAVEDLAEAQKLYESKSISDHELRTKRRLVERGEIAVARIKVQLEALSANPLQRK